MVPDLFSIYPGDFCNHGIWTYCSVSCRNVPVRIRYTSMSLPYHIGNGVFGGLLPAVATYLVTTGKDAGHATWYLEGLWYPIGVATVCLIIGLFYLKNKNNNLHD